MPPQLEGSSFKTLTGNKLRDQQALLLMPRGQPPGNPSPSTPVLVLPAAGSPLRVSPRGGGSGGFMAGSPLSPLARSFDRVSHLGWRVDTPGAAVLGLHA